jgi:hypothetical protein
VSMLERPLSGTASLRWGSPPPSQGSFWGVSVEISGMEDEMQGEADRGDQKPLRKALR